MARAIGEALDRIGNGSTVAVGGYLQQNVPVALLAGVLRRGVRDLTVVAAPSASLGVDLLVAGGAVRRVICPYVGFENRGPAAAFVRAVEEGAVERVLCDQEILLTGLRAAAQGSPSSVFPASGSAVERESPLTKELSCPFSGRRLLAVPALELDVALLHAQRGDGAGNLGYLGSQFLDLMFAQAARRVIAEVDELVDGTDTGAPEWNSISGVWTTAVVRAPGSAFPTASQGRYAEDGEAVERYLALERDRPGAGAGWLTGRATIGDQREP